jgi:hypothetical protein
MTLPDVVGFGVVVQMVAPAVPDTVKVVIPVGAIPPEPVIVSVNTKVDPIQFRFQSQSKRFYQSARPDLLSL